MSSMLSGISQKAVPTETGSGILGFAFQVEADVGDGLYGGQWHMMVGQSNLK